VKTRCRSPGSFASAWPELIIACDVRGRGLLQTDRTDITTRLHVASFAFTGADAKYEIYSQNEVVLVAVSNNVLCYCSVLMTQLTCSLFRVQHSMD